MQLKFVLLLGFFAGAVFGERTPRPSHIPRHVFGRPFHGFMSHLENAVADCGPGSYQEGHLLQPLDHFNSSNAGLWPQVTFTNASILLNLNNFSITNTISNSTMAVRISCSLCLAVNPPSAPNGSAKLRTPTFNGPNNTGPPSSRPSTDTLVRAVPNPINRWPIFNGLPPNKFSQITIDLFLR